MVLVFVTGEAGSVRVAARATDGVAADAELLVRAVVPATFCRVWQSTQELSLWQVVQIPGSARASSA